MNILFQNNSFRYEISHVRSLWGPVGMVERNLIPSTVENRSDDVSLGQSTVAVLLQTLAAWV